MSARGLPHGVVPVIPGHGQEAVWDDAGRMNRGEVDGTPVTARDGGCCGRWTRDDVVRPFTGSSATWGW